MKALTGGSISSGYFRLFRDKMLKNTTQMSLKLPISQFWLSFEQIFLEETSFEQSISDQWSTSQKTKVEREMND